MMIIDVNATSHGQNFLMKITVSSSSYELPVVVVVLVDNNNNNSINDLSTMKDAPGPVHIRRLRTYLSRYLIERK